MTENNSNNNTDEMLQAIRQELTAIMENDAKLKQEREEKEPQEISSEFIEDVEQIKHLPIIDQETTDMINEIKKMELELDKTYTLFCTIGDKFENIDFSCLGKRIRDLSLLEIAEHNGEGDITEAHDVRKLLDESYRDKTLDQLTEKMSTCFRTHPGEFGDIPEVSTFFQACTQLQHGLEQLHKQTPNTVDFYDRMSKATESHYKRINEIRDLLKERQKESSSEK